MVEENKDIIRRRRLAK